MALDVIVLEPEKGDLGWHKHERCPERAQRRHR